MSTPEWMITEINQWSNDPYSFSVKVVCRKKEDIQATINMIEASRALLAALESSVGDLFYQIESKHGAEAASKYPSIVEARAAIAKAKGVKP